MATRYIVFVLLIHAGMACTEDEMNHKEVDDPIESKNDTSQLLTNFQGCDSVAIATSHGTSCCVSGPTVAKPGDTIKYHYQINQVGRQIYWEILEGDLVIIEGEDTHTVTVEFGPNFTTGLIKGRARGDSVNNLPTIRCEEGLSINLH